MLGNIYLLGDLFGHINPFFPGDLFRNLLGDILALLSWDILTSELVWSIDFLALSFIGCSTLLFIGGHISCLIFSLALLLCHSLIGGVIFCGALLVIFGSAGLFIGCVINSLALLLICCCISCLALQLIFCLTDLLIDGVILGLTLLLMLSFTLLLIDRDTLSLIGSCTLLLIDGGTLLDILGLTLIPVLCLTLLLLGCLTFFSIGCSTLLIVGGDTVLICLAVIVDWLGYSLWCADWLNWNRYCILRMGICCPKNEETSLPKKFLANLNLLLYKFLSLLSKKTDCCNYYIDQPALTRLFFIKLNYFFYISILWLSQLLLFS